MLSATLQRRAGLQSSGDYTGYRTYASRRLKKLRSREHIGVKASKSYKPHELESGKWEIALLLAERSWAAAMTARAALDADAADPSVLKSQISSKLAKAVKYAAQVLAARPTDSQPSQALEFEVYAALVAGESALHRQKWAQVTAEYSKARVGLIALSKRSISGSAVAENVYGDTLTTSIDPALRLAIAQETGSHAVDLGEATRKAVLQDGKFAELVNQVNASALSSASAKSKLSEIRFREHTAQVRHESLAEELLKVRAKDDELSAKLRENGGKVDTNNFEDVLDVWGQLDFATSNLIGELKSAGQPREQDLDIISTYARFNLLYRRIQRDAIVASQETGKPNAVRLYDVILQSCTTMAELPGVYNDDELSQGINGMHVYFEAKRTLEVAALHTKGSVEALALVNLAHQELTQNENKTIISDSVELPVSAHDIQALSKEVKQQLVKTHAVTVLLEEVRNRSLPMGSVASDLAFVQLPQKGSTLVTADLDVKKMDPVPVKPIFYDIAFNYLGSASSASAPASTSDRSTADNSMETDTPKKKSLFGLF